MDLFLHSTNFYFFCLMSLLCVYFIVFYRTLCREPYFLRYRQLFVGGVTMYGKCRGINTVLNHCKSVLHTPIVT